MFQAQGYWGHNTPGVQYVTSEGVYLDTDVQKTEE